MPSINSDVAIDMDVELEKNAISYAEGYSGVGYDDDQIASVRDAFIDGAKWHKNHVWHKVGEEPPIKGKWALVEYVNDFHDVGFYDEETKSFQIGEEYVEMDNVKRWAYIEDLVSL